MKNFKKWKWISGLAVFFCLGNLAMKMLGNYWDGNELFSGSISFTILFWAVAGALMGYFISITRKNDS